MSNSKINGFILILLFLAFDFIFSYATEINEKREYVLKLSLQKKIYKDPIWKKLLHLREDKPQIKDPRFILSLKNFSPKNELIKTIDSFFTSKEYICKFPARFYWIKKSLELDNDIFPKVECKEFQKYLNLAPAQDIYLVYAGENLLSPTSMLGHVFLKLSGYNVKGRFVEHAISYYTAIDTLNIPYLLIKVLFTGMNGYFSLIPYEKVLQRYLYVEERNIWEYKLKLDNYHKKIIYYHIWELKDVKLKYIYTSYNCATLVHDIVSLGKEDFKQKYRLWITPKDVIKDAFQNDLILAAKLIPANKWLIKALENYIPNKSIDKIKNLFLKKDFFNVDYYLDKDPKLKIYEVTIINNYADYLYLNKKQSFKQYLEIKKALLKIDVPTYSLDISDYKSPIKTPDDSQIGIGIINIKGKLGIDFYFLPVSNDLSDDNRQYFNENMLKLMELELYLFKDKIDLRKFNIISLKNLVPRGKLINNDISWALNVGVNNHIDKDFSEKKSFNFSLGFGYSYEIIENNIFWSLVNIGTGFGEWRLYPYVEPEVGLILYEFHNMKSIILLSYIYNQFNNKEGFFKIDYQQAIFVNNKYKILAEYNRIFKRNTALNKFNLKLIIYF